MTLESGSCVRTTVSVLPVLLLAATAARGQPLRGAIEITSMGQPRQWEPYVVPAATWGPSDVWRGSLTAGVYHHVTHPLLGLFGFAGEAYATVDPGAQPGARLLATSRALGLAGGVDWD